MSINVMSADQEVKPAGGEPAKAEVPAAEPSAPEAKSSEQKEPSESDTDGTEAIEEKEDAEDDESKDSESKDDAKDKPKKKGGFQRRIDKLNARYSAAQAEAEHWKSMALKGAGDKVPEKVDEPKKSVDPAGKPNPDTFDTHAEYVEALTDWKIEQRVKAAKEEAAKTQLMTEQEKLIKAHTERVKSFAEKTDDFNDVLESVDDVPVSPTIRELLISSDNGPELMYELAKTREEFERINKLSPLAAARELGKIESRLAAAATEPKKEEPKKLTKAPKPIGPVGAMGGAVVKSIDDPNLSQAEYERLRMEQKRKHA